MRLVSNNQTILTLACHITFCDFRMLLFLQLLLQLLIFFSRKHRSLIIQIYIFNGRGRLLNRVSLRNWARAVQWLLAFLKLLLRGHRSIGNYLTYHTILRTNELILRWWYYIQLLLTIIIRFESIKFYHLHVVNRFWVIQSNLNWWISVTQRPPIR